MWDFEVHGLVPTTRDACAHLYPDADPKLMLQGMSPDAYKARAVRLCDEPLQTMQRSKPLYSTVCVCVCLRACPNGNDVGKQIRSAVAYK